MLVLTAERPPAMERALDRRPAPTVALAAAAVAPLLRENVLYRSCCSFRQEILRQVTRHQHIVRIRCSSGGGLAVFCKPRQRPCYGTCTKCVVHYAFCFTFAVQDATLQYLAAQLLTSVPSFLVGADLSPLEWSQQRFLGHFQ